MKKLLFLSVILVLAFSGTVQGVEYLYWANAFGGSLARSFADGTGLDPMWYTGCNSPNGLDNNDQYIFWGDTGLNSIGRIDFDGSNGDPTFITGCNQPSFVVIDDNYIYWTNVGTHYLGRANLDGSGVNQTFLNLLNGAYACAVDANYIYWARDVGAIARANIDGSSPDYTWISGIPNLVGVIVDDNYIYWTHHLNDWVGRANIDGTGIVSNWITGCTYPYLLHADAMGTYIYWANFLSGTIGRANIDGSGVNQSFITGQNGPSGMACIDVIPTPTPSETPTITPTATETSIPTETPTETPNPTSTPTIIPTATPTNIPVNANLIGYEATDNDLYDIVAGYPPVSTIIGDNTTLMTCPEIEGAPGVIYGANSDINEELHVFDNDTGLVIDTITMTFPIEGNVITAMEYVNGTLYAGLATEGGGGGAYLSTIDTDTGVITVIGDTGHFGPLGGLAYEVGTDTMYAITAGGGDAELYTLDMMSGLGTSLGYVLLDGSNFNATGLEFGSDGFLYGLANTSHPNADELLVIDPIALTATSLGNTGVFSLVAITTEMAPLVTPTPTATETPSATETPQPTNTPSTPLPFPTTGPVGNGVMLIVISGLLLLALRRR